MRAVACRIQCCAAPLALDDTVTDAPSATTWTTRGSSTTIGYSKRMSENPHPPHSAAATERVCSRTDIGMISTPLLWCEPGYGLVVGVRRACHRCVGGVAATGMCR